MSDTKSLLRYQDEKKSAVCAYLLWGFLGGTGAHRFYMGRPKSAVGMLCLWIIFIVSYIGTVGHSIQGYTNNSQAYMEQADRQMACILADKSYCPTPDSSLLTVAPSSGPAGFMLFFWATLFVWLIVDAIYLAGWVRRHNEALLKNLDND